MPAFSVEPYFILTSPFGVTEFAAIIAKSIRERIKRKEVMNVLPAGYHSSLAVVPWEKSSESCCAFESAVC